MNNQKLYIINCKEASIYDSRNGRGLEVKNIYVICKCGHLVKGCWNWFIYFSCDKCNKRTNYDNMLDITYKMDDSNTFAYVYEKHS